MKQKAHATKSCNDAAPQAKHWFSSGWALDVFLILIHLLSFPTGFKDEGHLYDLEPIYNPNNGIKMGVRVWGVDLSQPQPKAVRDQIALDITKHNILVFKKQGNITEERQKEISLWFGDRLDKSHRQHPKAVDKAVFRVSNDQDEGYTQTGNKAWHIDGFFFHSPHSVVLYYMASVAKKGDTIFIPLYEIVQSLPPSTKSVWDRVWFRCKRKRDIVHPLVYNHPITGKETLCFNLNFIEDVYLDYYTKRRFKLSKDDMNEFIQSIKEEFTKNNGYWFFNQKWEQGDFVITDNLAVGHIAHPDTQLPRQEIGLRLLHRTSILGESPPTKLFPLNFVPGNKTL